MSILLQSPGMIWVRNCTCITKNMFLLDRTQEFLFVEWNFLSEPHPVGELSGKPEEQQLDKWPFTTAFSAGYEPLKDSSELRGKGGSTKEKSRRVRGISLGADKVGGRGGPRNQRTWYCWAKEKTGFPLSFLINQWYTNVFTSGRRQTH